MPPYDQAGNLRIAVPGVSQVSQQYAPLAFGSPRVVKSFEHETDVLITLDIIPIRSMH